MNNDLCDFVFPAFEFRALVEVVVTVIAIVGLKPFFIISAMQPDITDRSGYILSPVKGFSESRLVDIAKPGLLLPQACLKSPDHSSFRAEP